MCESCRTAVVATYLQLSDKGGNDPHAFTVAVDVFRCRNPDVGRAAATHKVAEWVSDALGQ